MSRNYELTQRLERERMQPSATATLDRPFDSSQVEAPEPPGASFPQQTSIRPWEFKKVINFLFLSSGARGPRVVTFAPISSSSDPALLAARAGELLESSTGGTVCIVDANFGTPMLHEHFGVQHRGGLAGALQQAGPIQQFAHQRGRLWLITSGISGDGKALFRSEALPSRIRELRSTFDFTLIAAPAVGCAESMLLSKASDGVLLILEDQETRRIDALCAKEELQAAHVKLLGAVLNNHRSPIPESLYSRIFAD